MSSRRHFDFPELFPQPKQITILEGDSELSNDIRLVTSNVLPLQRKAIRSILTAAGVKVVANKKRYVVEATVSSPDDFDLADVPENCRHDYYELTVSGSEITIRTPCQEGMVWASQTLAGLFRRFQRGNHIPNLTLRDWPIMPIRGIFVECKWGPDRMTLTDWCSVIDALGSAHLNTLGIGLYGCWGNCRMEAPDRPTEFLMVPVPGHDGLASTHHLRWYSPKRQDWREETYRPAMAAEDFLADVVAYGRERGVNVVPYVNSLGHNTLIPRLLPDIAAKDVDGNPTGSGYCLSNPQTRAFLADFYGAIVDRFAPTGCDTFHVQLDEIGTTHPDPDDPHRTAPTWCQCPDCAAKSHEQLLQEHLLWLTQTLVDKGVRKVVAWNDMLTRTLHALDDGFAARLRDLGLDQHLVIDCWNYSNDAIPDTCSPDIPRQHGLAAWTTPMTNYYDWSTFSSNLPNVELSLTLARATGAEGAVSYSVHNPSHLDHEAALGGLAWDPDASSAAELAQEWATAHFDADADDYLRVLETLRTLAGDNLYAKCLLYPYTYVRDGQPFPTPFPAAALDAIQHTPDAPQRLADVAQQALQADEALVRLLERPDLSILEQDSLRSLRAEANRIAFNARAFAWLTELRLSLQPGHAIRKSSAAAADKLIADLDAHLAAIEANAPVWLSHVQLHLLSVTRAFLEQLGAQLHELGGRKKTSALRWTLATDDDDENPAAPQTPQA